MIREDQIDQQLDRLGLFPPSNAGWVEYLASYSVTIPSTVLRDATGGRHDEDLLRHVVQESSSLPTLLVTNDEDLFEQARRQEFGTDAKGTDSVNSTGMMLRLLDCGAVPEDLVEACLVAEYTNIEKMARLGMSRGKYDLKQRRLERARQQLVLRQYGDEWSPDLTGN